MRSHTEGNANHKPLTINHKPIKEPTSIATRLPSDWIIPISFIEYCSTKRPELDVMNIAEQFKNYWTALAGSKAKKLDWFATWKNWVMKQNAPKQSYKKPLKGHGVISDSQFHEWLDPTQGAITNG